MEQNAPWITCRTGKKCYLLAKDEMAYYLIEVGKNLDYATEEWLEQQGVSDQLLKELQLPFTYIPKKALRGVAFTGNEAGEYIYLYLKSEKKKLRLEMDYDSEWMEAFFTGIHRFSAPKTKVAGDKGWRANRQDKELFEKLRFVAPAFFVVGCTVSIAYVKTQNWIFYTLSLLCIVAQLVLVMAMPVYFTIYLPEGAKKQNVWELEFPLLSIGLILFLRSRFNWMTYEALWYILPMGALLGALVYWRVVDLHQEKWGAASSVLMGAIVACILAGQINEVYDFTEPTNYVLEVEDLSRSGGKRRNYYCTVTLPDGREEKLDISRMLYSSLEEGDLVRVEHGVGFFGIEYANVYSAE